jgi:ATP-dependent Clp protease protease subunit
MILAWGLVMPKSLKVVKNKEILKIHSKGPTKSELIIYGPIGSGMWDDSYISATQVSDALKDLEPSVKELEVRINSPGGDVFEGIAIYNRLKQFKGTVNVYIDGLAASISSIIALAGEKITIGEGALYMIHLPWTMAIGNRMDLENVTNRLIDVEDQLLGIYNKKTKISKMELRTMLEKETWLDAQEAMDMGFCDCKMEDSLPIAASVFEKSKWINKAPRVINQKFKTDLNNKVNELKEFLLARNSVGGVKPNSK